MGYKFNPFTGNLDGFGGGASVPTAGAVTSNGIALGSVAAGTIGNVLTDNGSTWVSSPLGVGTFNPTNGAAILFDDFAYTVINKTATAPMGPFYLITSNSNDVNLDLVSSSEKDRTGVINITNDATHAESGLFGDINAIKFGDGTVVAATSVYFNGIPNNSSNNWDFIFGYSHTWPNIGDGPVFAVSPGVSTTNWACLCYSAGSPTIVVTSVPYTAATWYNLRININAAGTSVTYFINGSLVATITTNITTSNTGIGYRTNANTANATNATRLDWLYQSFTPNTARGTF